MNSSLSANKTRKRKIGALVAGLATVGVVGASAASLGGVTSNALGADVGVVASCDTDGVTLAFTNAYDATSGVYRTTGVNVTGINAACNTKAINLTLKDNAGASIGSGSGTVAAGAATVSISPTASANAVVGAAVIISG